MKQSHHLAKTGAYIYHQTYYGPVGVEHCHVISDSLFASAVETDKASGFYLLKVATSVNFSSVQQAFVVENIQREEQLKLDEETKRKIEQQKK